MAKLNVILMAFILIAWTVFRSLFIPGAAAASIENTFISIGVNCQDEGGNYTFIDANGTVCLNYGEIINFDAPCTFVAVDGLNAIAEATRNVACAIQIGVYYVFLIVKILIQLVIVLFILIINIFLLVVLYLAIGLAPIDDAPPAINALLIGPFVLANFALVISFFTGD